MRTILSFSMLLVIKGLSHLLYKHEFKWIKGNRDDYDQVRLVVFLNHTSLYEPLFVAAAPMSFLWKLANKMVAPAADKTLDRPIVGFLWKLMGPGFISITRKRDKSWFKFLELVKQKYIIVIAPEGRMKRNTGLDSNGKPMSVRSGIAEIIAELDEGKMLIAYSAGLHHVQHPGEIIPRFFKTLKLNLELLEINNYKSQFQSEGIQFRKDIVADLERRILSNCPK